MTTWLEKWTPEDSQFWETEGKGRAWKTLWVTTASLTLSFATWFMISAIVVKLPGIGFKFTTQQLFWLAAMPGLAGGTLRILHTFLIPIYGTRNVVTFSTLIKVIPCIGIGFAVMDTQTPFWVFLVLAFLAGFGGGDFSSHMPSTSLFFPKRLQGTVLGIQAGIGNFGVSLAQFMTPIALGFATVGAAQVFSVKDKTGQQVIATKEIYLQSASFWYVPLLVVLTVACWMVLRSIPVRASFKEQLEILKDKHTWFCTIIYVMTFGSFAGLSASFPLMIKSLYGNFPDAPDPLKFAFYGPLIGSTSRVVFGFVSDKTGGAILTTFTGLGLAAVTLIMFFLGLFAPTGPDVFPTFVTCMLALFFLTGIGNAATFRQYSMIFSHNPIQRAGVMGWTSAVAAYGPFVFASLIGAVIASSGNANRFFIGYVLFVVIATFINWWFYNRPRCERPS